MRKNKKKYRAFSSAKKFVKKLGLKNYLAWREWCKSGDKPSDIPNYPNTAYKEDWQGWGDFLGTGYVAVKNRKFRSLEQAREFVKGIGVKSSNEWVAWCKKNKKPSDIPYDLIGAYKNDCKGWGEFLGTDYVACQHRVYMPFKNARAFVRKLDLKNQHDWREWCKTNALPTDIPASPNTVYKKEWQGWGNYFGTGFVATRDRSYRSFTEARKFANKLGLKSYSEWRTWCNTNNMLSDIPRCPNAAYKEEWQGWGDFLGTNYIAVKDRNFRPFIETRAFVRKLGVKRYTDWAIWCKNNKKPDDIPHEIPKAYKSEWRGWGDFLGTDAIANKDRKYKSFDEAREFIKNKGIKSETEWRKWSKSGDRPASIPSVPARVYKDEWRGWGDFLGTGVIASKDIIFRSYNEACKFVRALGLKNQNDWNKWCKTDKPSDIPKSPDRAYKDEWKSWGDFLGTGFIATQDRLYRPFNDAREFVCNKGFKNSAEWLKWCKTNDKPFDIPSCPHTVYDGEWRGWGYWLGIHNVWTKVAVVDFLKSILPLVHTLTPVELFSIIQQNGLINISRGANKNSNAHLIDDLIAVATAPDNSAIESISEKILSAIDNENAELSQGTTTKSNAQIDFNGSELDDLPEFKVAEILGSIDNVAELVAGHDKDTINFLINNAVNKVWKYFLVNNDLEISLQPMSHPKCKYGNIVKEKFLAEYNRAIKLQVPSGYAFSKEGHIVEPNLMQKFVACKIEDERSFCNWSGVGAGKTLSAILASRVINSKLTVIVALNATLSGWQKEIISAYPNSHIFYKDSLHQMVLDEENKYLLLNYEKFQQNDSLELIETLVEKHNIDFIVLDEIQSAKQRGEVASKRRAMIGMLIAKARLKNPSLCTLGISATPVINNLNEAVSLLKLVVDDDFSELKTYPSISNCLDIHKKIISHGVRYIPAYDIDIETNVIEVCGKPLVEELRNINTRELLKMERILLESKLNAVKDYLTPGTILYTNYVTGIVGDIKRFLSKRQLSYAEYTGDDKDGLQLFLDKKVDILIGSSTLGTGLDGLQKVCNKLILIGMPWTHSGYTQLQGRIYRQGSAYNKVQMIIPQIVLDNEGVKWSYDKYRMDRILFKKTLGDVVLDGVLPDWSCPVKPNHAFLNTSHEYTA